MDKNAGSTNFSYP